MRVVHNHRHTSWVFFVIAIFIHISQKSTVVEGQCPQIDNQYDQTANTTVYYDLTRVGDSTIRNQVDLAFQKWTAANQTNNSHITFSSSPPPAGATKITVVIGSSVGNSGASIEPYGNGGALISIYQNARRSDGKLIYDPDLPASYATAFLKATLHEIGHFMGLDDVPSNIQQKGKSVMNGAWGSNDGQNNCPTDVTICDTNAVNSNPLYSGSSGGGGGGSGPPCTPWYYVWMQSYDGGQTWEEVGRWYAGCW